MSPKIERRRRSARAPKNIIPISVRSVMRRDFIHPSALQREIKKNTPMIIQTSIAGRGSKKKETSHIAMNDIATARRVFVTLFQRETGSSFRFAKKTKKRLNTHSILSAMSIQNGVFPPVKYAWYGAIFARSEAHASAVSIASTGGTITGGSPDSVGSVGAFGSHVGRSPRSMSPSKNVRPSAANAREPLTVNPSGDVFSRIFPA
jgi:hypothetical protein